MFTCKGKGGQGCRPKYGEPILLHFTYYKQQQTATKHTSVSISGELWIKRPLQVSSYRLYNIRLCLLLMSLFPVELIVSLKLCGLFRRSHAPSLATLLPRMECSKVWKCILGFRHSTLNNLGWHKSFLIIVQKVNFDKLCKPYSFPQQPEEHQGT